jgi:hypothetical protein
MSRLDAYGDVVHGSFVLPSIGRHPTGELAQLADRHKQPLAELFG